MSEENNIPEHWQVKKLGEICQIQTGKFDAIHAKSNGKYRFYTCAFEHMRCDTNRFNGECLILPGNGANVGEVFYYNGEFDAYQRTYVINGIKTLPKFLYYHLLCFWKKLNQDKQFGSATNYIRIGNFNDYVVSFPPFQVQLTIVSKIEELMSDLENGKQQLLNAQQQLKVYRQSLLKAAFEGKLTNVKTVECELPKHWRMSTIGDVFEVFIGSTPKRNNSNYWGGNINWLSSGEIAFCNIKSTKEKITTEGLENTSCKIHPIGTVIIAMIGEGKTRGQAAILKVASSHNQNTAAIRVNNKIYKSELLYYYLVLKYEDNRRVGSGNNQKALNKERVKGIPIPIPPLKEQELIVDNLESKLTVCDKIEETIKVALLKSESLRQSILKKAFEGKLL